MLRIKDNEIIANIKLLSNTETESVFGFIKYMQSVKFGKLFSTPNQAKYGRSYSFINCALYFFGC